MIEKIITVFDCEFCNKRYFYKKRCETHESQCNYNPINERPCFSCKNFGFIKTKVKIESPFAIEDISLYHCKKKDICLISPSSEKKGLGYNTLTLKNYPMPVKCDDYE